jgi:hypothetical protein
MATATPIGAAPSRRMSLSSVTKGGARSALRLLIFGPEGVGKTSLMVAGPSPVVIAAESGLVALPHVDRFNDVETFDDVLSALDTLAMDKHNFKTVGLDSLDWIEALIWQKVCDEGKKKSIGDFPHGGGYTASQGHMRSLVARCEKLHKAGMNVVASAHSIVKKYENPEGEDYDRFEVKMNGKTAAIFKEWVDIFGFASWETLTRETENEKVKGVHTGRRLLYTMRRNAHDAKSRYAVPETIPLDWTAIVEAVDAAFLVQGEVEALVAKLGAEEKAKTQAWLNKQQRLPHELLWLREKLKTTVASLATKTDAKKEG